MLKFLKILSLIVALFMFAAFTVQAQDKVKTIGNKPRKGTSNASFPVVKGQQIGIKMNAGKKDVQLLNLNFGVENNNSDTLKFKVNVYEFDGVTTQQNFVKTDIIGAIPYGKSRVDVNLEPYNVMAKGTLLVAIEWLNTHKGSEPSFSIGLFNGGTYRNQSGEWKKMPVAGVDFNVKVKKLKK
ncbi:hypothetical protein [uncultured Mucilaginibacter sp.]|uniref:hypothetical protein n=1 Tax=uncultured Mucilaginibacter sp. TaxID=797541 RepID=UPI0025FE31B6|nr:hypothetical protein [uncultured Mucilaginibacter sp.]